MQIHDHKLAWRWTDPAYAVLSSEVLAQLHPATPDEAKAIHERSLSLLDKNGLSLAIQPVMASTRDFTQSEGRAWLERQQSDLGQLVVLSWDPESALRTTWEVFISHWPEFCYPASDDLVVFPDSEA